MNWEGRIVPSTSSSGVLLRRMRSLRSNIACSDRCARSLLLQPGTSTCTTRVRRGRSPNPSLAPQRGSEESSGAWGALARPPPCNVHRSVYRCHPAPSHRTRASLLSTCAKPSQRWMDSLTGRGGRDGCVAAEVQRRHGAARSGECVSLHAPLHAGRLSPAHARAAEASPAGTSPPASASPTCTANPNPNPSCPHG